MLSQIVSRGVMTNNAMIICNRLAASGDSDIQNFLDEFIHKWFLTCRQETEPSKTKRLYLITRFFQDLIQKKRFDPFLSFERWILHCNEFSAYKFVENLRLTLLSFANRIK